MIIKRVTFKKIVVPDESATNGTREMMVTVPIRVGCLRHIRAAREPKSKGSADIQIDAAAFVPGGWKAAPQWTTLAYGGSPRHWIRLARWCLRVAYTINASKGKESREEAIEAAWVALEGWS